MFSTAKLHVFSVPNKQKGWKVSNYKKPTYNSLWPMFCALFSFLRGWKVWDKKSKNAPTFRSKQSFYRH